MSDAAWVMSVADFLRLPPGGCTVIDVRSRVQHALGHVPGAVRLSWLTYRDGLGRTGRLPDDPESVARALGQRGVHARYPIVVYGDAQSGWGEDGRIAWMLRYVGYPTVAVLDGGWHAFRCAIGRPGPHATGSSPETLPDGGASRGPLSPNLRATIDDVQRAVDARTGSRADVLILDTRSGAEWNGSRRYWPARTGRIPGALHLEWRALLDGRGFLDRSPALLHRLAERGITRDRRIVTYCVGGVRSAHALVQLRALGFADVRNYDGSWYEWAADRSRQVERP